MVFIDILLTPISALEILWSCACPLTLTSCSSCDDSSSTMLSVTGLFNATFRFFSSKPTYENRTECVPLGKNMIK